MGCKACNLQAPAPQCSACDSMKVTLQRAGSRCQPWALQARG